MVASPLHVSDTAQSQVDLSAFRQGAEELGLNTERKPIQPQQEVIATVLEARNDSGEFTYPIVGLLVPRRASKTTTVFATLIGQALAEPDVTIAFTAQTGAKAAERFRKDIIAPLERKYRDDELPYKINRGRGTERITFPNGSVIQVLPPIPDAFRGDSFRAVFIDEAQGVDPEVTQDLLGAILPTFDTTGGRLIVAGTAGEARAGLFWETLQQGVEGKQGVGVVWYGAPDSLDPEDVGDPDVWAAAHPGIGTLTTLAAVERNYNAMSPEAFAREYLSLFPAGGSGGFINSALWDAGRLSGALPEPPTSFGLAFAVDWTQSSAAICAAWRVDGVAHVLVLDHRPGAEWVAERVGELARKYRTDVAYDMHAINQVVAEQMLRMRPRPRMAPQTYQQAQTAAALFMREIETGKLRHHDQDRMNAAAEVVTKRGAKVGNRWSFGKKDPSHDISTIEAASLALRLFDEKGGRARLKPVIAA